MWIKLNLVSQSRGDQWRCPHCEYSFWSHQLGANERTCPECGTPPHRDRPYDDIESEPFAAWLPRAIHRCHKCNSIMRLVPDEGNPLSQYVPLTRGDGLFLYFCPNKGCVKD